MAKWGIRRFVSTPRKIFFIIGGVPPTAPAPGTKRLRPCASSGSWGALTGENEVSADLLELPGKEFLWVGMCHILLLGHFPGIKKLVQNHQDFGTPSMKPQGLEGIDRVVRNCSFGFNIDIFAR